MSAGKGDLPRKVDKKKFDENWEEIFRKRDFHKQMDVVAKLRPKKDK